MFLTQTLDADFLCNVTLPQVSQFFKIPMDIDVEVQTAVYKSEPHPLRPLCGMIMGVLNQAGATLRARQCDDFADFILQTPKVHVVDDDSKQPFKAEDMVRRLAGAFASLNDKWTDGSDVVYFFNKAQHIVVELYRSLKDSDVRFDFPDIEKVTAFATSIIPTVLRHVGILEYESRLDQLVQNSKHIKRGEVESLLRACSVTACELLCRELSSDTETVAPYVLDTWLYKMAKEDDLKSQPRHCTLDTLFY
jgi:Queuosine salvage protein